jgi:excisionase family DNA binding protein
MAIVQKRFLTIKELSEYMNVPVHTLYSWTFMKKIPHVKMGRLVRFDLKEIDIWLSDKKIEVAKWWKE